MSRRIEFVILVICLAFSSAAFAFDSGSTGADGVYNPPNPGTATTVFFNMSSRPTGFYNFSAFTVPLNITVKFIKNTNNTPVTILSRGNVTINGTIDVSGTDASSNVSIGPGGPGGYDGGEGGRPGIIGGRGLRGKGEGGGEGGLANTWDSAGAGGGFYSAGTVPGGSYGVLAGGIYGSPGLIPLLGGSGGGGSGYISTYNGFCGGGGGGAILIATNSAITVNGSILAKGGNGGGSYNFKANNQYPYGGGGGSGGAIRLVADVIRIIGNVTVAGGVGIESCNNTVCSGHIGGTGGDGYIRLESSNTNKISGTVYPNKTDNPSTALLPNTLFPAATPSIKITRVGGLDVPQAVKGDLAYPDLKLTYGIDNQHISVDIAASNIPLLTKVHLQVAPAVGNYMTYPKSGQADVTLSGSTSDASTATFDNVTLDNTQANILSVYVTYPVTVASAGSKEIYAEGERVMEIKVASSFGGGSKVYYITESGKEVLASL